MAPRDEHDDDDRRAQPDRDAPGDDAGKPLVDHDRAVASDRLRDHERGQHRRREHLDDGRHARRQLPPAEQHRPRRLEGHRRDADDADHDPGHRRNPISAAKLAATIGTPGGANGRSTSVIVPATSAVTSARRVREVRREQREEERGERRVEPDRLGVEQVADDGADRRAAHPEDVEEDADAGEDRVVEAPRPAGERPRLVDDQLRLEEAAAARAGKDRRDREAQRDVAGVEEDRGDDRGERAAAVVEDRRRSELRRAGERRRRHHDRAEPAHARLDGEQAERGAEEKRRERERQPGADAVSDARGPHRLDATEREAGGGGRSRPHLVRLRKPRDRGSAAAEHTGECVWK